MKTISELGEEIDSSLELMESNNVKNVVVSNRQTVAMTRGWQCCKCNEHMYNDELNCERCLHRRCKDCRSFVN